jgi:hypothetical protein
MDSQRWPEELRQKLGRQNLPQAYIDRLVEELSDHLLDTQSETTSMDARTAFTRLGSTDQIAAAATHEVHRHKFAGRHPWLMFVFGPILITPLIISLSYVLMAVVLCAIGTAVEFVAGPILADNPFEARLGLAVGQLCNMVIRFVPFAVAAWIYCRVAKRCGCERWAFVACGIVALLAGTMISKITPAIDGVHTGFWIFRITYEPNLHQLLQVLVPLTVAGVTAVLQGGEHGQPAVV